MRFYDENVFYHWTYKEWLNRMQGAMLSQIDDQERAIQVAYTGAIVSREKQPKKPDKYFDGNKARNQILNNTNNAKRKKPDFTLYNKALEGLKDFDWSKSYSDK